MKLRKRLGAFRLLKTIDQSCGLEPLSPSSTAHQIGIPHPDCILYTNLAHKETIHPAERKLHEFDVLGLKVGVKGGYGRGCVSGVC